MRQSASRPRALASPLTSVLLVAFAAAAVTPCNAQDYPRRTIRIVAATTPGSGPDLIARLVAQHLSSRVGQPVIVDNRPGAGGNLGAEVVAKSPADGYTLLLSTSSQAISATLYRKLNYDLMRDFAPVSFIASGPQILVVHPSLPVKSLKDLVALARARPGDLLFGTGGVGTAPHLAGEMLKTEARIRFVHVPYKGMPAAITDLLGGQIHFIFAMTPVALPHIVEGRLRGVAITSAQRSALAPGVPTMAETFPGFEAIGWYGVLAPAGTPSALVQRLNTEVQTMFDSPDAVKRLKDQGTEPVRSTPGSFAEFVRRDVKKWGAAIIASNAQQD